MCSNKSVQHRHPSIDVFETGVWEGVRNWDWHTNDTIRGSSRKNNRDGLRSPNRFLHFTYLLY